MIRLLLLSVAITTTIGGQFVAGQGYNIKPDVVYGHKDGMALTFDVFEPKENAKGVGLLLMVSGGWVSAWAPPDKAVGLFAPFLQSGYTVFAVRHGSSPRYVIPEIAVDVRLALKHIYEHADEWKVDRNRLGVFGFSAGGHYRYCLARGRTRLLPMASRSRSRMWLQWRPCFHPPIWRLMLTRPILCASNFQP